MAGWIMIKSLVLLQVMGIYSPLEANKREIVMSEINPEHINGFMPALYWIIGVLGGLVSFFVGKWFTNLIKGILERVGVLERKVDDLVEEKKQFITRADFIHQVEKFESRLEDMVTKNDSNSARLEGKIDGLILHLLEKK